jgi:predicted secreted hydrolase
MKSNWSRREFLAAAPFAYQQALPGHRYEFPRDHFNHPDFRTEWWYYTGNVATPRGRPFGYELTIFRQAISRDPKHRQTWGVEDVYLAHLALSDIEQGRFLHQERLNRSGPGLAGASEPDRRIWNGNWEVRWRSREKSLRAVTADFSLDLTLTWTKPPVTHGTGGVSQKGPQKGEASHYISFPRLATSGRIAANGQEHEVSGASWMDHEYFSHTLGGELEGWDWFSLQFDNQTELMLYRLRRKDGMFNPFSSATFVDASGRARHLRADEFRMEPGRRWKSAATGASYPLQWKIEASSLDLKLATSAAMDNQELVSSHQYSPSYWEGAIRVTGSRGQQPLTGRGYLEMTGYDRGVNIGGGA